MKILQNFRKLIISATTKNQVKSGNQMKYFHMSATVKEDKRYFFFINDSYCLYLESEASDVPLISIACSKLISFKRINLLKLIMMKKTQNYFQLSTIFITTLSFFVILINKNFIHKKQEL